MSSFSMEYRQFGNSGLKVSRLGLGMMTFQTLEQSLELLETARNYGCNFFDGAEAYGTPRGQCEKLFGQAYPILLARDPLKWRRSDLVITTKLMFGPSGDPKQVWGSPMGENELGLSRKHIQEGMYGALKRTGLKYFDVVYAHRYDPITPMLEIVQSFTNLIRSNKAYYWGTSMWPPHRIVEAHWIAKVHGLIAPIVEQNQYSMLKRKYLEDAYLPLFAEPYNYATTIWGALDSGILTGKHLNGLVKGSRLDVFKKFYGEIAEETHEKVRSLKNLAENELDCSLADLAIAWTMKNDNVTVVILGASKVEQLSTFAAGKVVKQLDESVMKKIEGILKNKPVIDEAIYGNMGREKRSVRSKL